MPDAGAALCTRMTLKSFNPTPASAVASRASRRLDVPGQHHRVEVVRDIARNIGRDIDP
jgi:hypothetical protein